MPEEEKCFYDYKKNRYTVLDSVGETNIKSYLLKRDNDDVYYIVEHGEEMKTTEKPLRSVFKKFDSNKMYDIRSYGMMIEEDDLLYWDNVRYDVVAHDKDVKSQRDFVVKLAQAEAKGWKPIELENTSYRIQGDTLELKSDNKIYAIKERNQDLKFSDMTAAELKAYATMWTNCYNNTVGDLAEAQNYGENKVLAQREIEALAKTKPDSEACTKKLVEYLDQSFLYDGNQANQYLALVQELTEYMAKNDIKYEAKDIYLGDTSELSYDFNDVIKQYLINNDNNRDNAMYDVLDDQAMEYLKEKGFYPLNYVTNRQQEPKHVFEVLKTDDFTLNAEEYLNEITGATEFDIIAESNYPFFHVSPSLMGCCNQETLNKLIATQQRTPDSASRAAQPKENGGFKRIIESEETKESVKPDNEPEL